MQELSIRDCQLVAGGISFPDVANRAPSTEGSMQDIGTVISIGAMMAGLSPAGMFGRSVIFAVGTLGMALGMMEEES